MSKTPTQGYLDWRATLKPGYYWVENDGFDMQTGDDVPIHRIMQVIEITPFYEGARSGYWRGDLVEAGLYVRDGVNVTHVSYYSDWKGFRAEPVKPPSFL